MNIPRFFFFWLVLSISGNLLLAEGKQFYVSPQGNDDNNGALKHPFRTVEHARDAVRSLRQNGMLTVPVTVYLRAGTYPLVAPLTFLPEDGGSLTAPVTYCAYKNEHPVISGGQKIIGWKESRRSGRRIWSVSLSDDKSVDRVIRELWVNGTRRIRARYPNTGYMKVDSIPGVTEKTAWTEGCTSLQCPPGEIHANWTYTGAEAIIMDRWVDSRLPIVSIDSLSKIIHFGKRVLITPDKGDYYYIENVPEALDTSGEWWLDRGTSTMWYLPYSNEKITKTSIVIPRLQQIMLLNGDPESGRFIENLTFRGIAFAYSEWPLPDTLNASLHGGTADGGYPQAAVGVPGAIAGKGLHSVTFDRCEISHVGSYALELSRGCQGNRLIRSTLVDLGGGGVKIGETGGRSAVAEKTLRNDIIDCEISDGGLLYHSAVGIWIGQSPNNRIIHNKIHDFYYSGISIGWTWGYGPADAGGNIIELNDIHHIGIRSNGDGPILSDMGGIYTLGTQPGTVIRKNIFHDIAAVRYGGWGIYFDEGSTDILAENNLVYRTTHGGFHQHYGKNNIVRNNIFALGRDQQIQRTRNEDHVSFTFEHNIVYWKTGKLLAGDFTGSNYKMDSNIYWKIGANSIRFDSLSFDEWRNLGRDQHSQIADPGFVNPDKGDFSMKDSSRALKAGFRPLHLDSARARTAAPKPAIHSNVLYNMEVQRGVSSLTVIGEGRDTRQTSLFERTPYVLRLISDLYEAPTLFHRKCFNMTHTIS